MPDHGPTHPDDPGLSLLCFSVSVCLYLSVPRSRCMSLSIHCARVCARMCMCLPACLPAWFPIVCLSVSFFLPACCLPACLPVCLSVMCVYCNRCDRCGRQRPWPCQSSMGFSVWLYSLSRTWLLPPPSLPLLLLIFLSPSPLAHIYCHPALCSVFVRACQSHAWCH